ncbi:hypothetical protein [Lautropia mirabilis]
MIKRVLLLSSLMLSVPTWAATQPAAESAPVAKASDTATTATTVAAQGANALKESDGKDIIARDPKPDTGNAEHDALLVERRQQQRMVLHLRAKRDSELNRLSLARLAASRGGDPTFNEKKNQAMLEQMRGLQADYDRQLDKAQADLDAIDVRLAKFSGN